MYYHWLFGYTFAAITGMISTDCPRSWVPYQQSCYFFSSAKVSWHDASSDCRAFHSELVMIESAAENNFIVNYLRQHTDKFPLKQFWTDGTDLVEQNYWIWAATLQPIMYINWAPGEPNGYYHHYSEDCLQIDGKYKNYKWNDNRCDWNNHFICELKALKRTTITSTLTTKTTTAIPTTTTVSSPRTSTIKGTSNQTSQILLTISSRLKTTHKPSSTATKIPQTSTTKQKQSIIGSTPTIKATYTSSTKVVPFIIG